MTLKKSDVEIYITKCAGDAMHFVEKYCADKGPARFIACGGDGTLNEVFNGACKYDEAQIGVLPIGTGNDFCRNFSPSFDFSDIENQITGSTSKCDVIRYSTSVNGVKREGYCLNMINIGFDCNVADLSGRMKKKPLISGSMAYLFSIFINIIKKKGADISLKVDDENFYDGKLLLTSIANGCYCGGGIKSNPLASVNDNVMNVNIIKNIKRIQFIKLLPHYIKGTILDVKNIDRYLTNIDCRKIVIKPSDGIMRICIDGEIIDAEETTFEIIHNAINFVNVKVSSLKSEEIMV